MEFDVNGTRLRITVVQALNPQPFTVLGWDVDDIQAIINTLKQKGVVFEKYDVLNQDDLHIWRSPSGAKVAWFKDPDGNLLSLTEF